VPPKLELQESLPVSERADEIAEAIKNNQVVIVSGETGSGKTTQLPKIAMMVGRGQKGLIGHTQPRRIARLRLLSVFPKKWAPKSAKSPDTRFVLKTN